MDWYENPQLSPNYDRLANTAFVYTNSHNDTVSDHGRAWAELLTGRHHPSSTLLYPTPLHYVRSIYMNGVSYYRQWRYHPRLLGSASGRPISWTVAEKLERFGDLNLKHPPIPRNPFISDALGFALIPQVMKEFKPQILLFHQVGHDVAHGNGGFWQGETAFSEYEKVCRTTDEQIGRIFDFVRNDPYFSTNTAIVVRPEFGRDDEVNAYGELGHSESSYQTRRSAEIWYGPDFNIGKSDRLTNRRDVAPSIARLFNLEAPHALGTVHSEMFRPQA